MNIIDLTGENRNNLTRVATRRCSFCRIQGHNINNCNDNRLIVFENDCRIEKQRFELSNNPRTMFRNWLCDKSILLPFIVRSFAVRKCGSRMSDNINICIDNIIRYIYPDNESNDIIIINPNDNEFENFMRNIYYLSTREMNNILEAEILLNFRNYIFQNETSSQKDNRFTFVSELDETNNDTNDICECAICYDDDIKNINFVKLNCNHKFCNTCLEKSIKNRQVNIPCCALCRSEIKTMTFKDKNIKKDFCKFNLHR
jgi:hypothetical protein